VQGYMAYVDVLIGVGLTLGFFWLVTTEVWHRFVHSNYIGRFFRGRLVCRHCADEEAAITRNQWREEVIDKVRRAL
jgi:hypothetical protein